MEQDWFEKPEVSQASLKDFEELSKSAFALRAEIEADEARVSEKKSALTEIQLKMQALLEEAGLDSFKSSEGTIYIQERTSFKVPVEPEKRKAFFDYLKEKGAYDALISVNYQTLNSFCKTELEGALKEGNVNFKVPGIEDPAIFREIRMRRGK
jgi:hypothetical protein